MSDNLNNDSLAGQKYTAPVVPSPIPPWRRPVVSPLTNTLFGDGTIGLTFDTTYFDSTTIRTVNNVEAPYQVTLPNGNHKRQIIRLYNRSTNVNEQTSAKFIVTGNFAGFTSLQFDNIGFSAVLEWDGDNWVLIGGNANVNP